MNSCAVTDKGIVRRQNQDSYYVACNDDTGVALLMVCDGMGGAKAGNVASDLACKVFADAVKDRLADISADEETEDLLKSALQMANTAVFELSVTDFDCRGMGTTLVAAVVKGKRVIIINVGDSRAYRVKKDGIQQVTRDHSVVEDMIERGKITREESKNHPNKHLITRAVGTSPEVACDIFRFDLEENEKILLCSDGLTNVVSDEMILELTQKYADVNVCGEELVKYTVVNGAPDNVTLVLFEA